MDASSPPVADIANFIDVRNFEILSPDTPSQPAPAAPYKPRPTPYDADEFRATAIVSTYASEKFIRGCLQDLVTQTLFEKGQLEILIIDAASPQNEAAVVREFQEAHGTGRIRYHRTPHRETLYASWNRAIDLARGTYLTNANTDDRHHPQMLARLADTLDANPGAALAYCESHITHDVNTPWADATHIRTPNLPAFSREKLFTDSFIGPHPMWRRSVPPRSRLLPTPLSSPPATPRILGSRLALRRPFINIPEPLGLCFENARGHLPRQPGPHLVSSSPSPADVTGEKRMGRRPRPAHPPRRLQKPRPTLLHTPPKALRISPSLVPASTPAVISQNSAKPSNPMPTSSPSSTTAPSLCATSPASPSSSPTAGGSLALRDTPSSLSSDTYESAMAQRVTKLTAGTTPPPCPLQNKPRSPTRKFPSANHPTPFPFPDHSLLENRVEALFVDENVNILRGKDAEKAIGARSDARYLTEGQGIVRVPRDRWKIAQTARAHSAGRKNGAVPATTATSSTPRSTTATAPSPARPSKTPSNSAAAPSPTSASSETSPRSNK